MGSQREISGEFQLGFRPRYDLDDDDINQLTERLLTERPPSGDDTIVCYRLDNDSSYANVARSIECEIFEQYFSNDAAQMKQEYGPYENQSVFFLSIDAETKKPVGVLRAITNGQAGLKTLNDLEEFAESGDAFAPTLNREVVTAAHHIESLDECWDVGTVAVRKPYRSDTLASVQLYRALYVSAMENEIKHFISIIDARPYEKMTKYLGIPFVPMADSLPFPYLGSESSQAVYGDVTEFYSKMNRKRWTLRGILARKALTPLVKGTRDSAIQL